MRDIQLFCKTCRGQRKINQNFANSNRLQTSVKCPECSGKGFLTANSSSKEKEPMFNNKPIVKKVPKTSPVPSAPIVVKKGRGRPKKSGY